VLTRLRQACSAEGSEQSSNVEGIYDLRFTIYECRVELPPRINRKS